MRHQRSVPRTASLARWVARVWSFIIFAGALIIVFSPDPDLTEPVPPVDWLLPGLWGVAILGLLIAWRWERIGGLISVAAMFFRELAWILLKGEWW